MAKFRNIHKRRSMHTGRKKVFQSAKDVSARTILFRSLTTSQEEYFNVDPMTTEEVVSSLAAAQNDAGASLGDPGVLLMSRPMAGEGWANFGGFIFSRLCRWLRDLFAAARFTHPAAWLLVSRQQSRP